jgi:hypothetical protein
MTRRTATLLGLMLPISVISYISFYAYEIQKAKPPGTIDTFEEYLRTTGPPRRLREVVIRGRSYLVVTGPMRSLLTFPSGAPQYIFDQRGHLVAWTTDSGDDPVFKTEWLSTPISRELTLEEGRRWFFPTGVKD